MYRGPPRGSCIGSIYPTLLGFGGIQAIILSYMVSLATRRRRGRGGGARGTPDPTPAPTPAPGPGGTPWPSFSAPWPGRIPMWPFQGQGVLVLSPSRRPCSPLLLLCSRRSGPRPLHPASSRPGLGGGTRPHWRSPSAPRGGRRRSALSRSSTRVPPSTPPHMPASSLLSDPHTPFVLLPS